MKKIIAIASILFVIFAISGCGSSDANIPNAEQTLSFTWTEKDFSFYDQTMDEKVFPTVDDEWIRLHEHEDLQTFRGIEIGDRGTKIADLYDLSNFDWYIADFYYMNPSTDQAEEYESELRADGKTTTEIFEMLDEIAKQGLDVGISCSIYESGGALNCDKNGQLKYEIWFQTDGEVVRDVVILKH